MDPSVREHTDTLVTPHEPVPSLASATLTLPRWLKKVCVESFRLGFTKCEPELLYFIPSVLCLRKAGKLSAKVGGQLFKQAQASPDL